MAGPTEQITAEDLGIAEHMVAPEPTMWGLIARWLERLADTQFSGDVVILIVLVALAPWLFGLARSWIQHRRNGN